MKKIATVSLIIFLCACLLPSSISAASKPQVNWTEAEVSSDLQVVNLFLRLTYDSIRQSPKPEMCGKDFLATPELLAPDVWRKLKEGRVVLLPNTSGLKVLRLSGSRTFIAGQNLGSHQLPNLMITENGVSGFRVASFELAPFNKISISGWKAYKLESNCRGQEWTSPVLINAITDVLRLVQSGQEANLTSIADSYEEAFNAPNRPTMEFKGLSFEEAIEHPEEFIQSLLIAYSVMGNDLKFWQHQGQQVYRNFLAAKVRVLTYPELKTMIIHCLDWYVDHPSPIYTKIGGNGRAILELGNGEVAVVDPSKPLSFFETGMVKMVKANAEIYFLHPLSGKSPLWTRMPLLEQEERFPAVVINLFTSPLKSNLHNLLPGEHWQKIVDKHYPDFLKRLGVWKSAKR